MKNCPYIFFFLVGLAVNGFAQDNAFQVIDWKFGTSYNAYLIRNVYSQFAKRDSALEQAMQSPEKMVQYRENCKVRYKDILGELPSKSPLNAQIIGSVQQQGFRIENVIYESLPDHHVTANLYVPDGTGSFPAVLLFCGHEISSKATESYQKTARLFALNGFVVLVVDCISQGEMIQLTDSSGMSLTRGSTTEHTLLNAGSNLLGTSVAAYELWDNLRALDYLESRTEVDKDRIGCLGNSGGGTQTMYIIGFDPRIKVAAPCSFITRRGRSLELANAADGCQHIPNEGSEQLEMADFLIMFAPKPLFILAGYFDFVDYRGTQEVYTELKKVYACLDKPEQVGLFAWEDGHGITKPKREAAVTWFRRWLCNDPTPVKEGGIDVLPENKLFCTSTGQANSAFANEITIQEYNQALYQQHESVRNVFFSNSPDYCKTKVLELLGIQMPETRIFTEEIRTDSFAGGTVSKILIRRLGEIPVPCLLYIPRGRVTTKECTVWFHEAGKAGIAKNDSIISAYMKSGNALLLADLRGIGETSDRSEANNPKYWNREYRNAMISLHIGRSIVGQRVIDLFSMLDFVKSIDALRGSSIKVKSDGIFIPVALHAAYLDKRINTMEFVGDIPSYVEFISNPLQKDVYSHVLYGVAKYYDLTNLETAVSNKGIRIIKNIK